MSFYKHEMGKARQISAALLLRFKQNLCKIGLQKHPFQHIVLNFSLNTLQNIFFAFIFFFHLKEKLL